jgi:hypothetical protein
MVVLFFESLENRSIWGSRLIASFRPVSYPWSYLPQKNRLGPNFSGYLMIPRDASLEPIFKVHNLLFILARYLVLVFHINSTYRNLLWKTGVFLNVISGPEVGIGKYVIENPTRHCKTVRYLKVPEQGWDVPTLSANSHTFPPFRNKYQTVNCKVQDGRRPSGIKPLHTWAIRKIVIYKDRRSTRRTYYV